ncbi:MAG: nucleotidyltransferase family protein, partial [Candidatus Bathyarchaeia archaeon]
MVKNKLLRRYYLATGDERFKKICEIHEVKRNILLKTLSEILKEFKDEEVNCVVIKQHQDFLDDIDILVANGGEKEIRRSVEILRRLNFHISETNDNKIMLSRKDGDIESKIHLHREIEWNGFIFHDRLQIWKNRMEEKVDGVSAYVPSPADQIIVLLAHALFENCEITLNDSLTVREILSSFDVDARYIIGNIKRWNWYHEFLVLKDLIGLSISNSKFKIHGIQDPSEYPLCIPIIV